MDPKIKQATLRMISNGMYVVTSSAENKFGAATVTWISQVSFKPPLVLAALRSDSNVFVCLAQSRSAAVHILSKGQEEIAKKFFSPTHFENGLLNGEPFLLGVTNVPILQNIQAHFECSVRDIIKTGGDHSLVVMEVIDTQIRGEVDPLLITNTSWNYGG